MLECFLPLFANIMIQLMLHYKVEFVKFVKERFLFDSIDNIDRKVDK